MTCRTRYIVAIYEIDRAYGGAEEGGWWYECGALRRVLAVEPGEDGAYARAACANRLIDRIERGRRDVSSMAYGGGRHAAHVFEDIAPRAFPEVRPHSE